MTVYKDMEAFIASIRYMKRPTHRYSQDARKKVKEIFCGFDIETTKGDLGSYMYCWQFSCAGYYNSHGKKRYKSSVFIGRTWDQLEDLMTRLIECFRLHEHQRLLVLIHNLKFEWQFIRKRFARHITSILRRRKETF